MNENAQSQEDQNRIVQAKAGNSQALSELIEIHMPLIHAVSKRFSALYSVVSKEDMIQAGVLGFLRALRRYSSLGGASLSTYAMPWILGEMRLTISKGVETLGSYPERKRIEKAAEYLQVKLNRSPTIQEISAYCGLDVQHIGRIVALGFAVPDDECESNRSANRQILIENLENEEECELRIAIASLPDEEKNLMYIRYFRDKTQKEAAVILGKSQAQISRIENRALERLRNLLGE